MDSLTAVDFRLVRVAIIAALVLTVVLVNIAGSRLAALVARFRASRIVHGHSGTHGLAS